MNSGKMTTVRHIDTLAKGWRQPCFTGEDHEARFQQALSMIAQISDWALHPARGDDPPKFD